VKNLRNLFHQILNYLGLSVKLIGATLPTNEKLKETYVTVEYYKYWLQVMCHL